MNRVQSFALDDVLQSTVMNTIQDNAAGIAQLPGLMVPGTISLTCTDKATIQYGAIKALVLGSNVVSTAAASYTPTSPALVTATQYYLYASDNGSGGITISHSTTVPDSSQTYKNSTTTHRYLGSFATDPINATTDILCFHMRNGRCVYRRQANSDNVFFTNTGNINQTSFTDISLLPWIPAHAPIAIVEINFRPNGVAGDRGEIKTKGDSGNDTHFIVTDTTNFARMSKMVELHTDSSRKIQYKVSASCELSVFMIGWQE